MTTVIHESFLPFIQLHLETQFFLVLKAYSHSACVHFMRYVFSNTRMKKAIMQFQMTLGTISKNKQ